MKRFLSVPASTHLCQFIICSLLYSSLLSSLSSFNYNILAFLFFVFFVPSPFSSLIFFSLLSSPIYHLFHLSSLPFCSLLFLSPPFPLVSQKHSTFFSFATCIFIKFIPLIFFFFPLSLVTFLKYLNSLYLLFSSFFSLYQTVFSYFLSPFSLLPIFSLLPLFCPKQVCWVFCIFIHFLFFKQVFR